jgi:glucose/arabinose dehydrogenase
MQSSKKKKMINQQVILKISIVFILILTACQLNPTQPISVETRPIENDTSNVIPTLTKEIPVPPPTSRPLQPKSTNTPLMTSTPEAKPLSMNVSFPDPNAYQWEIILEGLDEPVSLANARDHSGRVFIVEKVGKIRILQDNELLETSYLDIRDRVGSSSSEQGLLGLAFHPNYSQNGFFYVNYTNLDGDTVISRFQVTPENPNLADQGSEQRILFIEQPFANHNGGAVEFGLDGFLYLGLGDGGSAGDPNENAENPNILLGKILRLDVDNGIPYAIPAGNPFILSGGKPEVWAYGLRNPWRIAFDRQTGELYIADVGQDKWEEVNFLPAGTQGGVNFGWDFLEGSHEYEGNPPPDVIMPILEYDHSQGCSITGGVVYRGQVLPEWQGIYLYSDLCSGNLWGLLRDAQGIWQSKLLFENIKDTTTYGEDESGEVYLAQLGGRLLRLERKEP